MTHQGGDGVLISDPVDEGGLRPRTMILLIAGLVLLVLAIAFVAGREQRSNYQAEMDVRLRTLVMQRANIVSRTLEDWRAQVRFLTLTPPVSGLARAVTGGGVDTVENSTDALWRRRLESIFSGFIQAKPGVVRVSYLSVTDRRPLVIVDNDEGQLEAGDRMNADLAAIDKVAHLEPGSIHVDDLDPVRSEPALEIPARPLLRLASPVAGPGGVPFGVLVVTIDARGLLADLAADVNPIFRVYLTDAQENFLLHPDPARSFGMARGRPWRWQDEFKPVQGEEGRAASKLFDTADGLIHAVRQRVVIDAAPGRYLTVSAIVPDRLIAANAQGVQLWVAGLGVPLTGIVALLLLLSHQARRRNQAIRARDAWLGALIHSARDAIIGLAPDGNVTSWNEAATQLFGVDAAHAIGRNTQSLIVPPGLEIQEQDLLNRVRNGDSVVNLRTRRQAADGRMIDVSITATPVRAGNRIVGTALVVRDVTEQLAAEARLRGMTAKLEQQVRERTMEIEALAAQRHAIMDGTGAAIIACDPSGTITLFNPAAEAALGHKPQDLVGKATPAQFLDPAELALRAQAIAAERGDRPMSTLDILTANAGPGRADLREWTFIRRDGSRLPVLAAVTAPNREGIASCLIVAIPRRPAEPQSPVIDTAPPAPTGGYDIPGIDMDDAMNRVMGDRALLDSVLAQFADRFHGLGATLRGSLAAGDVSAAMRKLHEFRGAAGNIAAQDAMELATTLEETLRDAPDQDLAAGIDQLDRMSADLCAAIRARTPLAPPIAAGKPLDLTALRGVLRARRLTAPDVLAAMGADLTARLGKSKFVELSRLVDGLRYDEALALLDAELTG
ncbi:PAS domain S-box protein [Niveispirillum cyanobacteriorum]|uniref:PAS domain S-box protein n=1 Tax=Niveispirillum cyanobacteriorum TaxID=1612173 RepID=UPI00131A1E87|nr:PAS domain S-box protein [Niveispirillum cyanobacteriorum]